MKRILMVLLLLLVPVTSFAGAGYEKGFFINNDDDSFRLRINGKVQNQLYFEKTKLQRDTVTFNLRRAEVAFNGKMGDIVSLGFELKHTQSSVGNDTFQNVNITGATASAQIIPQLSATVGMVGLPLSIINEMSSSWFLLDEQPIVVTRDDTLQGITPLRSSFGTPDGLGLNLSGEVSKWFYSASVVNGTESNYNINDESKQMSFGFRTGYNIMDPVGGSMSDFECSATPKLTVSAGSTYSGSREDPTVGTTPAQIKYLWTSSAGVAFRWAGLAITTEGFFRRTKISDIGSAKWARSMLTDIGYYAGVGYYAIPKKLEVALQASQVIRQGPANDSFEFGGALNWYIVDNNLKLQLAYRAQRFFSIYDENGDKLPDYTMPKTTNRVTLMAQALF